MSATSVFCTFFRNVFSRRWLFCPHLCFGGWKELPSALHQRVIHYWQYFWHWVETWKVHTDIPRLVIETDWVQFCSISLMSPNSTIWYLQLCRKHIFSSLWEIQEFLLEMCIFYVTADIKVCVLNKLFKCWVSLVTLSCYHLVVESFSEQKKKKNKFPLYNNLWNRISCDNHQKRSVYKQKMQLQTIFNNNWLK